MMAWRFQASCYFCCKPTWSMALSSRLPWASSCSCRCWILFSRFSSSTRRAWCCRSLSSRRATSCCRCSSCLWRCNIATLRRCSCDQLRLCWREEKRGEGRRREERSSWSEPVAAGAITANQTLERSTAYHARCLFLSFSLTNFLKLYPFWLALRCLISAPNST